MSCLIMTFKAMSIGLLCLAAQDSSENASEHYRQAFVTLELLDESDWNALLELDFQQAMISGSIPAELRNVMDRAMPALEHLAKASQCDYVDFDLDRSEGMMMLVPHLSPMRNLARLADVAACINIIDGDMTAASTNLGLGIRVTRDMVQDDLVVSSLVGGAVMMNQNQTINELIAGGMLPPELAHDLNEQMSELGGPDPFRFVGAVSGEKQMLVDWLREQLLADDEQADYQVDDFLDALEVSEQERPGADFDIVADMDLLESAQERMTDIFAMADRDLAAELASEFAVQLKNGEYGLLANRVMPSLVHLVQRRDALETMLAEQRLLLHGIASGRIDADSMRNAAVFYAKAAAAMQELAPQVLDMIETIRNAPEAISERYVDEAGTVLMETLEETRLLLDAATSIKECDISVLDQGRPAMSLPWIGGFRALGRFLVADAMIHMRSALMEPRPESSEHAIRAADRLVSLLRLIGRISDDGTYAGSLLAMSMLEETMPALEMLVDEEIYNGQQVRRVHDALDMVIPDQLLGLAMAREREQDRLVDSMGAGSGWKDSISGMLKRQDEDAIVYIIAVLDSNLESERPRTHVIWDTSDFIDPAWSGIHEHEEAEAIRALLDQDRTKPEDLVMIGSRIGHRQIMDTVSMRIMAADLIARARRVFRPGGQAVDADAVAP
ncbi:MAG: hypothetical protein CMJ32_06280 [Phycisphaerae bacterium]|nr:hypothetical protein [Phycisphaerae bacterium]